MLKSYSSDNSGSVVVTFAVTLLVVVLVIGAALDLSRLHNANSKLQDAADMAVLSAALEIQAENKKWRRTGKAMFGVNTNDLPIKSNPKLKFKKNKDHVELTVDAELKPMIMHMFGYKDLEIQVFAAASLAKEAKTEVAILLDISNSMLMGADKFTAVQRTVNSLLRDFEAQNLASNTPGPKVWASVVPFGENVAIVNRVAGTTDNDRGLNWFGPFDEHSPDSFHQTDFGVCPELRDSRLRNDSPPSSGRFPVWSAKVIPPAMDRPCTAHTIQPLTDDMTALQQSVTSFRPVDNGTRLDFAVLWGWRALSPRWRGEWWTSDNSILPHNYRNQDVEKVLIVLTDGENYVSNDWAKGKVEISANKLNQRTLSLCEKVKRKGITIFFVDYMNPRGAAQTLKSCASSSDHYFTTGNEAELQTAFNTIREQTTDLAIIR